MSDPSSRESKSARLESADNDPEASGRGSGGCQQQQEPAQVELVVRVRDAVDDAHPTIQDAFVTVEPAGGGARRTANTGADGRATFQVTPGNYDVTAAKDWYLPEPRQAAGQNVPADPEQTEVDLTLQPLRFYLHVDADRDGRVDDDRTGIDNWQWGAANKGAVILCNNDHDDGEPAWRRHPDHEDNVVNQGNDNVEIAPLEIRRHGSALPVPGTWTAQLSVPIGSWRQRIRVFEAPAAGSNEVLGPTTGRTWDVPLPAGAALACGMEATRYAGALFNGVITLTLTVTKPGHADGTAGPVRYSSQAQVRVAPWIMPHHGDDADRVYVVDMGNFNQNFRQDLDNFVQAAGCALDTRNHRNNQPDRWMQDCMEIGYSVLPGHPRPRRIEAAMKAHRDRGLDRIARELLDADVGFHEQGDARNPTTFDSTGNLEVTPPVRDQAGHLYPWGRIYYGNGGGQFNPTVRQFLEAQVVQAPIQLDTDWLYVGHVDEMISFVPTGGMPLKRWKLLVASPRRAYEILGDPANAGFSLLVGRDLDFGAGWVSVETTVADFLHNDTPVEDPAPPHALISSGDLRNFNLNILQPRIDAVVQQLRNDIQLLDHRIVRVPVLFMPENAAWTRAGALTADMVNMLVINRHCIVPRPFGPENGAGGDLFQQDLAGQLTAAGLTVRFINDWYSYHAGKGEVHCGTNTLRRPRDRNAWLGSAAARWWEYVP